jgi:hypothetical protein
MRSSLRHAAVAATVGILAAVGPASAAPASFASSGPDAAAKLPPSRQRTLADEVVRLAIGGQDRVDARVGVHDLAGILGHQPRMKDISELTTRVALRRVIAIFGDRFSVDDAQAPAVRAAVSSTLTIPDMTFRQMAAAGVSVWVGGNDITAAPGSESLNGTQPEVDGGRPWSTIPGVYLPAEKRILVDAVDEQGTRWTLLHEFGHAIDFALGLNQSRVVKAVQPRIAGMMMDAYYYDPDQLDATRHEFVAETVAWYLAMGYAQFRAQTSSKALADYYRDRLGPT